MPLQADDALPTIRLEAAVSGRVVDNSYLKGKRAVLVVHGAKNTEVPKAVAKAVRERFPDAQDVVLASVVDLRSFAGLWRKVAEAQVKSTYEKLAAKATELGLDAGDHVLIVPDWDGSAAKALGVDDPGSEAAAIVVGKGGHVLGVARGGNVGPDVVGLLER